MAARHVHMCVSWDNVSNTNIVNGITKTNYIVTADNAAAAAVAAATTAAADDDVDHFNLFSDRAVLA